jgi:glucose/arabinose dehydrogenase
MRSIRRAMRFSVLMVAIAGCHDSTAPGGGGTLPASLKADPFVTGLSSPVFLTQPLNDGRIFVVEQGGTIRVIRNGALQATPFLDITTKVTSGGERGLFSVAFHPQYATNHFFYVYYTAQASGAIATGDIVVERYTTMTTNPEAADPTTARLIITTAHSLQSNHNGGLVSFGLDGMLYAGFGDGGGGGDPYQTGQDPNALLGSLLRLDVSGNPYTIPPSNPFVGQANKRGEIWAKGLRNPWRYAFDATTGLLYIADVGQNAHEEVDVVPASQAGVNYGWSIMEGATCYNAATCTKTGLTLPVIDYATHVAGTCSVTGGYVYRGSAIPGIRGHYFYSDYCAGSLRSFRYENGAAVDQKDWGLALGNVPSFGVDFAGELYVISGSSVLKIAAGS